MIQGGPNQRGVYSPLPGRPQRAQGCGCHTNLDILGKQAGQLMNSHHSAFHRILKGILFRRWERSWYLLSCCVSETGQMLYKYYFIASVARVIIRNSSHYKLWAGSVWVWISVQLVPAVLPWKKFDLSSSISSSIKWVAEGTCLIRLLWKLNQVIPAEPRQSLCLLNKIAMQRWIIFPYFKDEKTKVYSSSGTYNREEPIWSTIMKTNIHWELTMYRHYFKWFGGISRIRPYNPLKDRYY